MFHRKMLLMGIGVLLLTVGLISGSTATAQRPVGAEQHCVALIDPLLPAQKESKVTYLGCSDRAVQVPPSTGVSPADSQSTPSRDAASLPSSTPSHASATLKPDQHCVAHIDPIQPGQKESRVTVRGCFNTFAEAISFATGGAVRLPATTQPSEVTQEMLLPSQGTVVIGIDSVDAYF